jgi:hypothetical protein
MRNENSEKGHYGKAHTKYKFWYLAILGFPVHFNDSEISCFSNSVRQARMSTIWVVCGYFTLENKTRQKLTHKLKTKNELLHTPIIKAKKVAFTSDL